jgi:hypothetical protein
MERWSGYTHQRAQATPNSVQAGAQPFNTEWSYGMKSRTQTKRQPSSVQEITYVVRGKMGEEMK